MKKVSTPKDKLWKIMKVCAVQGMMVMVLFGTSIAHPDFGQLLNKKVTIEVNELPLETALQKIESVAGIRFVYSADDLNLSAIVSIFSDGVPLQAVLDQLFEPRRIRYKVHERESTITLKKIRAEKNDAIKLTATQQKDEEPIIVTGTVTDANRQPIAGVNVIVKGTTTGTTTDANGKFSISADGTETLVFSFIGFKSVEASVNGRAVVEVTMEDDVKSLDEVVVNAGYWSVTEKERTGNISRITSEEISKQPISNSVAAMQARMPGIQITQSTGVPGGNFKVRIRGTNSIGSGNDPLYIIDGVPYVSSTLTFNETAGEILGNANPTAAQGTSPLNNINPTDIESIEVLKDAAATAIYGSRGANGVILITTRKGKAGVPKATVSVYHGIARVANFMDLLGTSDYIRIRKEAQSNDNIPPTPANSPDLMVWDTTRYTDWQKELLGGTAQMTDVQASLSGGDAAVQYFFSTGYHRETTVFPGDDSDRRITTHLTVTNASPASRLKSTFSIGYAVDKSDLIRRDLTGDALRLAPNAPALYDENGNLSWVNWNSLNENPVANSKRRYEALNTNLMGNANLSFRIIDNLDIRANLGYTGIAHESTTMSPKSSVDPATLAFAQNQTYFANSSVQNWIAEPQLNWQPVLSDGKFNVLIGSTFLEQSSRGLSQNAFGFTSEALMKNLASAPNRSSATNFYSQYRYAALFGRVNYVWKEKYIVDLTARRDGSSRFGPGKQFANFGAVGAAWLFSEEDFISQALPVLSYGKLRMSYGVTGNDQIGDYAYLDTYRSSTGPYQTTVGLTPVRLSNPDFGWETSRKLEAAMDLGVLDNRLTGSISYYRNRSSNQLIGYPLAPTAGFTNIQGNFPATVQNTGIEFDLASTIVDRSQFKWRTTVNLTLPRNELIEFPGLESSPTYANTYAIGHPLNVRKLYHYTGVNAATGLYTFEDVNGDGVYNIEDRTALKFLGQTAYGGLANTLNYRSFELSLLVQFVKQTGVDFMTFNGLPGVSLNQPTAILERWRQPGDDTDVQRVGTNNNTFTWYQLYQNSDRLIVDASFIRFRNASLSYTLPRGITQKWHASNARIFVMGQNLMTLTKYKGLDPENQNTMLPPLRVITCGLSITF